MEQYYHLWPIKRENIKQRQKEGIASAKNKGIKFGRPKLEVNSVNIGVYISNGKMEKLKVLKLYR